MSSNRLKQERALYIQDIVFMHVADCRVIKQNETGTPALKYNSIGIQMGAGLAYDTWLEFGPPPCFSVTVLCSFKRKLWKGDLKKAPSEQNVGNFVVMLLPFHAGSQFF